MDGGNARKVKDHVNPGSTRVDAPTRRSERPQTSTEPQCPLIPVVSNLNTLLSPDANLVHKDDDGRVTFNEGSGPSTHNETELSSFGGEHIASFADPWDHAHELQSSYGRIAGSGARHPERAVPRLLPWNSFMADVSPPGKTIEPVAFPSPSTIIARPSESDYLNCGTMVSWADARTAATATATEGSYHVPAVVRPRPPSPWESGIDDVRQGVMTGHEPTNAFGARIWHQQASPDHLSKVYADYHGSVEQSSLGVPHSASATPRVAGSTQFQTTGGFAPPLPSDLRYGNEYVHSPATGPTLPFTLPVPQSVAGMSPCLKTRAPTLCTPYASESPEMTEPIPVTTKHVAIPPAMPPMMPLLPGHAPTAALTPAPGPATVPVPPAANTNRERRKRGDIMLEGLAAVIHSTPFKCEWPGCNDRFRRNEHLKRHMTSHTGEKPFVCWIPGCWKSFSRSDNLNVHYSTTHSKRGGRNRYVATLDETSLYYDPSYRGDLTPDGLPVTTTLNMKAAHAGNKPGASPEVP